MQTKIKALFDSLSGREIYSDFERAISDFLMDGISDGVIVGLSGGADSVFLLLSTMEYRRRHGDFKILAVHVNHMIRGAEAERDEQFSERLCRELGIEYVSRKIDVPTLAKNESIGLEEAARKARYSFFDEIIKGRNDVSKILVAHNADDNFETVIMNMMRGAGTRGISGIAPVRDNILRPLIYSKKTDIVRALSDFKIEFVTDSTNESDDYTRNYIRHNIIPAFYSVSTDPLRAVERMCRNLREDDECLSSLADEFVSRCCQDFIPKEELNKLHPSLLYRVLNEYFKRISCGGVLERVHTSKIAKRLNKGGDFSLSLPGGVRFVCERDKVSFVFDQSEFKAFRIYVPYGKTDIPEFSSEIELSIVRSEKSCSKVYNNSTYADLSSAIIIGDLFLRNKEDGDAYFYGGMTHKLKKLFNDRKIPSSKRSAIPVLCDEKGIVWVPGFGVRDDGGNTGTFIRISTREEDGKSFYLPKRNSSAK